MSIKHVKLIAREVNVREKASANAKVIGQVNKGDVYELNDIITDAYGTEWYQITYKGRTGYIRSDLAE